MNSDWDPRQDDDYADYLRGERLAQAAHADARRLEASNGWAAPEWPTSLYDQLAETPPEIDWIFHDLWPAGVLQVNSQKKAGKTTLMANAVRAIVTGEPFLGRFEVNVESDCRVCYLNMELTRGQFNRWLDDMALPDDAQKRIVPYHGREFGRLDFHNDAITDWLAGNLREGGVDLLVLDPLGSFYDQPSGGDPNAAYLRWWARLEHVVLQAGLRGVLIVHHTGYSEDGAGRARGASAMMDKPDVNVTYRYNVGDGAHTDAPVDTKRYLSAFGRDVDVSEFEVDYNARTRQLSVTGGGGRLDAEMVEQATRAWNVVTVAKERNETPNKGELFDALGWTNTGAGSGKCQKWYRYAVEQQWITADTSGGKGKPIAHSPGPRSPYEGWKVKRNILFAEDGGE